MPVQILVNTFEKEIKLKEWKAFWQAERVQVHQIVQQGLFYSVL